MDGEMRFDGRVALVTGAGGGLGRGYALELARRGARVVVNDLGGNPDGTGSGSDPADQVIAEIRDAGGEAIADYHSVATTDGGVAMVQATLETFGRLDIVISNAGILRDVTLAKMTDEQLDAVLGVHLRGAFNVARPAFAAMAQNMYGRFVFATSGAGLFGNFGQSNYSAAKMGLVGLSNTLAIEGERKGITANVVAPMARTRLTEQLLGPMAAQLSPEHVTPLVVYLCSEQCALTHEVFSAGGGHFARVFVGETPGWTVSGGVPASAEEVAAQIDLIRDESGYFVPRSAVEEMVPLAKSLATPEAAR